MLKLCQAPLHAPCHAAHRRSRCSRGSVHGLLALAVLVAAFSGACDNPLAPESCGSVPEQTIPVGKSASLRVCFNDGDGDRLSLSARSSDKSVVTVVMRGSIVTVTGARAGTTTVTVTAEDPGGLVASVSFAVWVPRVVQLTTGSQPVWSPDGSRVAFVDYGIYGESVSRDIHVIRPGDIATRLTRSEVAPAWYPAWSPDGSRIAFMSGHGGGSAIYVMNADGSGATNLTKDKFPSGAEGPVWSPDGGRIAFRSLRDGNRDIYVMDADGSGVTNLTNHPGFDGSPAWSPDGSRIAFTSHRDGTGEIHVMNADGSGATNLTNNPGLDGSPAWSPDGSRIAFDSHRDGNRDIYVMNADGSGATNLTNSPAHDWFPVWSPDGSRIAFHRGHDLYVVNVDGSGTANLAVNALGHAWSWSPVAWSPDGRTILFNCGRSHVCLVQTSHR